jgi:hypothetical protein
METMMAVAAFALATGTMCSCAGYAERLGEVADAMSQAVPSDSGGFLKPGYSVQPDGNRGLNVYDSQGYRGNMNGSGYFDNQEEGYTA